MRLPKNKTAHMVLTETSRSISVWEVFLWDFHFKFNRRVGAEFRSYRDRQHEAEALVNTLQQYGRILKQNQQEDPGRILEDLIREKQEELRRFSEARNKKLKDFVWQEDGLMIVLPQSVDDIVAEGKALAHCVGGYAERHFKGQTTILFLRKTEEPDKPFYTMEINKTGKIQQCYGYRNNTANNPKPPEIKAFERHYEQYLQEVIHGKRNHRAARQSA